MSGKVFDSRFPELRKYIDRASSLYQEGKTEESLAVLAKASQNQWPPAQRGILLAHMAHFHSNVTGRQAEAMALAYQAISALSGQPPNTEGDLARIGAESLLAHSLWESDPRRAAQFASNAVRGTEHLIATCEDDQETLWEAHYSASRLHALSGQWEKAIESARRAGTLAVEEDQKKISLVELGCILRAAGRNDEARGVLQEAQRWVSANGSGPPSPRIDHELALAERALGNWEQARVHIERAIDIVRNDAYMPSDLRYWKTLQLELSEILHELGELRKEAQVYRDLICDLREDDQDSWAVRLSLARCEVELLRFEAAWEVFDLIQRSAPTPELRETGRTETLELRYRIAVRDYEAGDYETAIKESEAILPLCEGDPELHASVLIMLGNGHAMLKEYAQARSFYHQVVTSRFASRNQRDQAEESLRRLANV